MHLSTVRIEVLPLQRKPFFNIDRKAHDGYRPSIRNVKEVAAEKDHMLDTSIRKANEELGRKEEQADRARQEKRARLMRDGIEDRKRSVTACCISDV